MEQQRSFNKIVKINQEVDQIILDESFIKEIKWINDDRDLHLTLNWPGQSDLPIDFDIQNARVSLIFEFAVEINLNIQFPKKTMGAIEMSSYEAKLVDKMYDVRITFSHRPTGSLTLRCNRVQFIAEC